MAFLMEVCKGIFFFLSALVGLFLLRGDTIINQQYYIITKEILMPGYLVFCGIMLGYIYARIQLGFDEDKQEPTKIYNTSFLIGIGSGIFLAILYIII